MKEDLRCLRHARYGFDTEVSQGRDGPSIEVGWNELTTSFCGDESVGHELGTEEMSASMP